MRGQDEAPAGTAADLGWAYWRPAVDGIIELGTLRGREVALPAHFHEEDQVTFVVSGRRRFFIGGELVTLSAGQSALIPAGVVHRSLAEPFGVACLNAYLPAGKGSAVPVRAGCREPVSRAAARVGMSREGFSRMFARHHGMPPHAFWLTDRLNRARRLLRAGEAIAAIAAETGFTDQSHFGHCFRRAFGTTPGRYRSGWLRSQTCQTGR